VLVVELRVVTLSNAPDFRRGVGDCADAAKSKWVAAEWKCALSSRGAEFIDPVPLCGPDAAPPPEELAAKHFDDWTLAFRRQAQSPRASLFARLFGAR